MFFCITCFLISASICKRSQALVRTKLARRCYVNITARCQKSRQEIHSGGWDIHFGKNLGLGVDKIIQTWTKPPGALPLNQAYPDFCLRSPFPFKITFDAKYFFQNSESAANKALVEGAYEAMFYRGLPSVAARNTHEPSWDYDYGCLLAYDASDDGILESVWRSVRCKGAFWDGANIFVMIVRGTKQT